MKKPNYTHTYDALMSSTNNVPGSWITKAEEEAETKMTPTGNPMVWYDDEQDKKKPLLFLGKPTVIKLSDVKNPKDNPDKPMTVADGLQALDDACPRFMDPAIASVVYPGLTALQAVAWAAEVLVKLSKTNQKDAFLHPLVEARVKQICANKIGKGNQPDSSVATAFAFALSNPPAPAKPSPIPKPKPYERKFS